MLIICKKRFISSLILISIVFLTCINYLNSNTNSNKKLAPITTSIPITIRTEKPQTQKALVKRSTNPFLSRNNLFDKLNLDHGPDNFYKFGLERSFLNFRPGYMDILGNTYSENLQDFSNFKLNFKSIENDLKDFRIGQRGHFWVLYNYIQPEEIDPNSLLTYAIIGEYNFLRENLQILLKRFNGPISLSIYSPGSDFEKSVEILWWLYNCDEDLSKSAQKYLSVHFYFDSGHLPRVILPRPRPTYTSEGMRKKSQRFDPDFEKCSKIIQKQDTESNYESYRTARNLSFPINVGRNIARENAQTQYVLSADIELYPSINLPQKFAKFIENIQNSTTYSTKQHSVNKLLSSIQRDFGFGSKKDNFDQNSYNFNLNKHVFVLPVFELNDTISVDHIPQDKKELVKLFKKQDAISFHANLCNSCHRIPFLYKWIETQGNGKNDLKILGKAKRRNEYKNLEPFFIGKKWQIPSFDERLTWEGKKNKMNQGFILCVQDFDLLVLDNAFLVHRPGIKKISDQETQKMHKNEKVSAQNQLIKNVILPELKTLYGHRPGCIYSL